MTEHFISLNLKFAARAPILDNEDSDFWKVLKLLKVAKIDLFSITVLGRLVLISKSIV